MDDHFLEGFTRAIRMARRSRFYDAIKMSRSIYERLLKACAATLPMYPNDLEPEAKETFMGLEIFVDDEALMDYVSLCYAADFRKIQKGDQNGTE